MATPEDRPLALATCILAAALVGLPWVDAGLSPAGQATVVLLVAMAGAAWWLSRDTPVTFRFPPLLALGVLLVCASAVQTIYPDRTIQALLLLMAYTVAGVLAASAARKLPWTERILLDASVLSGLLVVAIGSVWLVRGNDGGFYTGVLIGPFGYPNALAGFLLLVGAACLATLQSDRYRIERRLALVGCVACLLGLYFARSRGAWLAAAVGFLCWVFLQKQLWWPHRWRWGALAALVFLGAFAIAGVRLAHPLMPLWPGGASTPVDTSVQWRLSILRWTCAMIADHPWLGVGPGAFPVALTHYQQIPYVGGENPHNLYLEIAAEYGLAAGFLLVGGLLICLGRVALSVQRFPIGDPIRSRRAALLAGLVAFGVHSGMDLDWSFPAVALLSAMMLGVMVAGLPRLPSRPPRLGSFRVPMLLVLVATGVLGLTRYYSATLVSWGRESLTTGNPANAQRYLTWASRLNPLSYPALYWLARARLQSGDAPGAMRIAEHTLRLAPKDPNTRALAGDMALAAGRWEAALVHFQRAVDRAPAAQLRFHAGLLDAGAAAGKPAEALRAYARALSLFTEERVLGREARCLAPGDRYLLARMSRVAANLYQYQQEANSADAKAAAARADRLSQPDPRGICATGGGVGQTSPETAIISFWTAWNDGDGPAAERYLLTEVRRTEAMGSPSEASQPDRTRRVRVDRVYSLTGGEHRATVVYQLESEGGAQPGGRCATTSVQFTPEGWLLEALPNLGQRPCSP